MLVEVIVEASEELWVVKVLGWIVEFRRCVAFLTSVEVVMIVVVNTVNFLALMVGRFLVMVSILDVDVIVGVAIVRYQCTAFLITGELNLININLVERHHVRLAVKLDYSLVR